MSTAVHVPAFQAMANTALPVLLDAAIKATVLLGLAVGGAALLKRASAAVRHTVWFLAILALGALPVLTGLLPSWRVIPAGFDTRTPFAATGVEPRPQPTPAPAPAPGGTATAPPENPTGRGDADQRSEPFRGVRGFVDSGGARLAVLATAPPYPLAHQSPWGWPAWVVLAWATGVTLTPLLLAWLSLWRLGRRSRPITDGPWIDLLGQIARQLGLHAQVRLAQGPDQAMPMVWGALRPTVLLPGDLEGWSADRGRLVLLHELAHVKRRDYLTHLLARVVVAFYWFHPLAWVALHRLRVEREQACDDLVLSAGLAAPDYAQQFLQIATGLTAPALAAAAAQPMARRSTLEGRLLAILDKARDRRPIRPAAIVIAAAALATLVVPVAMLRGAEPRIAAVVPATTLSDDKVESAGGTTAPSPTTAPTLGAAFHDTPAKQPDALPVSVPSTTQPTVQATGYTVEAVGRRVHGDLDLLRSIEVQRRDSVNTVQTWKGHATKERRMVRGDSYEHSQTTSVDFAIDQPRDLARWNQETVVHRWIKDGKTQPGELSSEAGTRNGMVQGNRFYDYSVSPAQRNLPTKCLVIRDRALATGKDAVLNFDARDYLNAENVDSRVQQLLDEANNPKLHEWYITRDGTMVAVKCHFGPDNAFLNSYLSNPDRRAVLLPMDPVTGLLKVHYTNLSTPFSQTVFLDPQKDFSIVRIEQTERSSGRLSLVSEVLDLQKIGGHLWFPIRTRQTLYALSKEGTPYKLQVLESTVDPRSLHVNVDLDPKTFEITFPPGTHVRDDVKGLQYVVGAKAE